MASLSGKTILITRSAHQANELVKAIERIGGQAVLFSTIEILPPASWTDCDRAIDHLYMYDGLIFTSTNGVEFFFKRLKEKDCLSEDLKSKLIFVVGAKTKSAVEKEGCAVTLMPEKFTASDLSNAIEQMDLNGKSFLFPRGNIGKNMLQDNLKLLGANVDSVTVYQTAKPKLADSAPIKQLLSEGKIDAVTFTSPSTFNNFAALFNRAELDQVVSKTKIAVIGPETAKAVEAAGLEADIIAGESTVEGLVRAIAEGIN